MVNTYDLHDTVGTGASLVGMARKFWGTGLAETPIAHVRTAADFSTCRNLDSEVEHPVLKSTQSNAESAHPGSTWSSVLPKSVRVHPTDY